MGCNNSSEAGDDDDRNARPGNNARDRDYDDDDNDRGNGRPAAPAWNYVS